MQSLVEPESRTVMANGTWEEARQCPKCEMTGEQQGNPKHLNPQAGGTRGARLVTLMCKNSRCRWFNSTWEVQINPDGTIPDPKAPREKRFRPVDAALAAQTRARLENLQDMTTKGGEVYR